MTLAETILIAMMCANVWFLRAIGIALDKLKEKPHDYWKNRWLHPDGSFGPKKG